MTDMVAKPVSLKTIIRQQQEHCLEELTSAEEINLQNLPDDIGMYQYARSARATICSAITQPRDALNVINSDTINFDY
jgi:hypothetical protein